MLYNPSNFDYQKAGKEVLYTERQALNDLEQYINIDFNKACNIIYTCSGKVILIGMGKSGHIAKKIAATLASTGTPSFFIHASEAGHGDIGMVSSNDVIIAISNSGESNEILTLIPLLKRKKIKLICITGNYKSNMALASDVHLCIKVHKEACPFGLAPTTSSVAILVMGDALAISVLKARGFTQQDFALSHPSGILGRKLLLHVSDIMHVGNSMAYVELNASIFDAVIEMSSKKLGLTVIVNNMMYIKGIFTDGDLRRIFNMNLNFNVVQIQDVMTPGGIQISPNMLASEALNIMQLNNITALLVAHQNYLLGIVHMHDILRTGVI